VRVRIAAREALHGVVVEGEGGRVDVAGDEPERVVRMVDQQRQRLRDAAGGFERAAVVAAFHRVADRNAEAGTVAECRDDAVFEPRGVDDDLAHAGTCQRLDVPFDQRFAAHRQQRLRRVVAQRPHAFAAAGGKDHGPHQKVYPTVDWRSSSLSSRRSRGANTP